MPPPLFIMPGSLADLDQLHLPDDMPPPLEEEDSILEGVAINPETVAGAVAELMAWYSQSKPSVFTVLKGMRAECQHNRLLCWVPDTVSMDMLMKERPQIVKILREQMNNPTVRLEVHVDQAMMQRSTEPRRMTGEQLMVQMAKKNPALRQLIEKLNGAIDY